MAKGAPATFFSYCREDSGFVLRLAGDLKAAGANVWLDQLDILPGERWDRSVEDALTDCRRMVVICPRFCQFRECYGRGFHHAEERKTVIPVIYRDCTVPLPPAACAARGLQTGLCARMSGTPQGIGPWAKRGTTSGQ